MFYQGSARLHIQISLHKILNIFFRPTKAIFPNYKGVGQESTFAVGGLKTHKKDVCDRVVKNKIAVTPVLIWCYSY